MTSEEPLHMSPGESDTLFHRIKTPAVLTKVTEEHVSYYLRSADSDSEVERVAAPEIAEQIRQVHSQRDPQLPEPIRIEAVGESDLGDRPLEYLRLSDSYGLLLFASPPGGGGSHSFLHHLKEIASRLPLGVLVKEVTADFTYLYWNGGMQRLFGLEPDEVIGRSDFELFSQEIASAARAEDLEVVRRRGRPLFGRPRSSGSDENRKVQHAKFLIHEENHDYIVSFVTDVTRLWESKRALKEANEWKGLLLSVVSHDVLAPLNSLTQGLEQFNDSHATMGLEQRERSLSLLRAGAQRTEDLLEDILIWSSSGDRDFQMEAEWMDLGDSVQRVARRVSLTSGTEIALSLPATLQIRTNRPATETVLRNLISNGCEHAHGGEVKVAVGREGDAVVVTVVNGGPGIPEPFLYSLNRGDLPEELRPGLSGRRGIGLQLCLTLTKSLGGTLRFDRPASGGTEVRFRLS